MAASRGWRKGLWITLIVLVLVGWGVWSRMSRKPETVVQTSKATRQDLVSIVTASGEIKPLTWVNISATAYGQITDILVKEGQRVTKGQVLAHIESVQPAADVDMQKAVLASAESEVLAQTAASKAAAAAHETAKADTLKALAEAEKARLEFARIENLHRARLASQSDYDNARAAARVTEAAITRAQALTAQTQAQFAQAEAQLVSARRRVEQSRASLARVSNVLTKHSFISPLAGLVTNLPVHVGENVVMGIQNAPGSSLMTIADMSVITAEVKVDETDIVNVRLGQSAEVTIDAYPDKKFTGKVTEIGNTAIVRSTGQATSLSGSGSQEAKDFKVVVTLDKPPDNLRPGFSTTAKIRTATKEKALSIPIQAITIRKRGELDDEATRKEKEKKKELERSAPATAKTTAPRGPDPDKEELQGVFVVRGGTAEFVTVKTGITGITDIEIDGAVAEGEEVVTGSYKALHTLKHKAAVRVDNQIGEKASELEEGS